VPAIVYINFTPQRRVRQPRVVSLQKQLFTLLLRGLFTINIWLCLVNSLINIFCCTTWLVGIRCRRTMSRLTPLPYFWDYKTIVRVDPRGISSLTKLLASRQNLLAFCVLRQENCISVSIISPRDAISVHPLRHSSVQ
jgi:hypothetical protein